MGRNGDFRGVIFAEAEEASFVFVVKEGVWFVASGEEDIFWIRCERRGVTDGESICRCYNMSFLKYPIEARGKVGETGSEMM